jgi:pimeloyl-ACP methyl ester carboxylesterase
VEQVHVKGLRIAYEHAGQSQPLLLLHGFFGDTRVWRPQLDELSDECEVVAWDTPGCGHSSDPPETFRIADYARCLGAEADPRRFVFGFASEKGVGAHIGT